MTKAEEMGLKYVKVGDYYLPDIQIETIPHPLTRWGMWYKEWLRKYKPHKFNVLASRDELFTTCYKIEEEAKAREKVLIEQYLEKEPGPDRLKDPEGRRKHLETIRLRAEQVVREELTTS